MGDLGDRFRDLRNPRKIRGRYYLLLIEIFSRKIFCRALPNKSADAVLAAFKDIVERDMQLPYRLEGTTLETDRGKEFAKIAEFLKSRNVFHSFSYARNKARYIF